MSAHPTFADIDKIKKCFWLFFRFIQVNKKNYFFADICVQGGSTFEDISAKCS